eukprot:TRINITY_DN10172_c0_g1_i3.p1 TRINITY_DN10172_c0_g1~~TRINITY_DN10172_c0_g1_i3.p1  ORF type:complete len:345 (-),score=63.76 TRINITY_DN10172_c0_g1_i3:35-1069(-)
MHRNNKPGKFVKIEFEYRETRLLDFINLKSLNLVEELTSHNMKVFQMLQFPMVLVFLDMQNQQTFNKYHKVLEKVASRYEGEIVFSFLDNEKHKEKRRLIGITHDRVPAAGMNLMSSQKVAAFPGNLDFNEGNLQKWIEAFLNDRMDAYNEESKNTPPSPPPLEERPPVYQKIQNLTELNHQNFKEIVLREGKDVMVFFFNSKTTNNLEYTMSNYNRIAERFLALKIFSVLICTYDLGFYPAPTEMPDVPHPSMFFYPAYDKGEPYRAYTEQPKALAMMRYIEKNADIKIKLPDLPHLPEDLHEAYYRQKYEMDKHREEEERQGKGSPEAVSYTHLTLPTIYSV